VINEQNLYAGVVVENGAMNATKKMVSLAFLQESVEIVMESLLDSLTTESCSGAYLKIPSHKNIDV